MEVPFWSGNYNSGRGGGGGLGLLGYPRKIFSREMAVWDIQQIDINIVT